jgi:hypothetical protein
MKPNLTNDAQFDQKFDPFASIRSIYTMFSIGLFKAKEVPDNIEDRYLLTN